MLLSAIKNSPTGFNVFMLLNATKVITTQGKKTEPDEHTIKVTLRAVHHSEKGLTVQVSCRGDRNKLVTPVFEKIQGEILAVISTPASICFTVEDSKKKVSYSTVSSHDRERFLVWINQIRGENKQLIGIYPEGINFRRTE